MIFSIISNAYRTCFYTNGRPQKNSLNIDVAFLPNYSLIMSSKTHSIENILGKQGRMANYMKGFEFRPSQTRMAHLIEKSIDEDIPVIIEAGTGTGKTLGYLVPLVLSGKKIVISTGTKNLQEQIFLKDIPLLTEATGIKLNTVLMKGRKNYLCQHKYLQFALQTALVPEIEKRRKLIEKWLSKTIFADRSELSWLEDNDPLWDALSSTSDQCLGSKCLHMEDCYLNNLRRAAAKADIIVVNHHLFFADLMVKKGGFGEIIPRFQVLAFDEAHNIEEIATNYFGESLSTGQLLDLIKDVEKTAKDIKAPDLKKVTNQLNLLRVAIEQFQSLFNGSADKGRLDEETLLNLNQGPVADIRQVLNYIRQKSALKEYKDTPFQALISRAENYDMVLEMIFLFDNPNWLNWYEKRKRNISFYTSPLDIAENMQELLYDKINAIIFTSATLSTNKSFDYIRSRLGIYNNALEGICPSHFDFDKQTLLYIPKDLPTPNSPEFPKKAAQRIIEILNITLGRTMVLFTSYYNLNTVHQYIVGKIPFTIYKQGDAPRSILLNRFKDETDSVLLATGSFWQGVDVPGESLSCLIVDKLPFDSPGDPLVAARIEAIRARKGNPFMDYQLPSAIISLKQGLGRLIRKSSDMGILSILDNRIINSRYGHFFLDSLPKMPVVHNLEAINEFFHIIENQNTNNGI